MISRRISVVVADVVVERVDASCLAHWAIALRLNQVPEDLGEESSRVDLLHVVVRGDGEQFLGRLAGLIRNAALMARRNKSATQVGLSYQLSAISYQSENP